MNKAMFWMGMAIIAIVSILMLTVEENMSLGLLGFLGLLSIGASRYRPLKQRK